MFFNPTKAQLLVLTGADKCRRPCLTLLTDPSLYLVQQEYTSLRVPNLFLNSFIINFVLCFFQKIIIIIIVLYFIFGSVYGGFCYSLKGPWQWAEAQKCAMHLLLLSAWSPAYVIISLLSSSFFSYV